MPPIFSILCKKMLAFSQYHSSLHLIVCITLFILSIYNAPISAAPRDHYLLNCGLATATTTSFDDQTWYSDDNSTFAAPTALGTATTAAWAPVTTPSTLAQVPCGTARIFNSSFTYSFPVNPGPKFIRLYFCPVNYSSIPNSKFFLDLKADGGAGPFTLLHNFSAYLDHQHNEAHLISSNIIQEYLVIVNTSRLNLTFFPTSPDSLAFVSGIEIVSVPKGLYDGGFGGNPTQSPCAPIKNVNNPRLQFSIQGPVALQTVVRLNVGGGNVAANGDSGELLRTWISDKDFVAGNFPGTVHDKTPSMKINYTASVPPYTAPDDVYLTAMVMGPYNETTKMSNNLTWAISVDPGFDYLVRLHFCEIDHQITGGNQRVFNIYINNQTAEREADVMAWANDVWGSPVCRDYVVTANGENTALGSLVPLWLALHPDNEDHPQQQDAILNGLEVFKLSLWNRSLAAPNPPPTGDGVSPTNQRNTPGSGSNSSSHFLPVLIGGVVGGTALSLLVIFAIYWWRVRDKAARNTTKFSSKDRSRGSEAISSDGSSSLPSHLCKRFTLHQIKVATRNFDEKAVIGVGGFGKVYKGSIPIDGEPTTTATPMVAIKRLNPSSNQGALEFRTEIEMLTKLRHVHLVSLIGYCNDDPEMILVYEYMPRGTLRDHLYARTRCSTDQDPDNAPLTWKERLKICIGAAHGLQYLHGGAMHPIIHRDVKSTNILLDDKWTAKVSDFGLCKVGPKGGDHVSTQVKGSIGYLDPEYHRLLRLTDKSDVYSFGVVLFEVLCGRPAMNATLPKEKVNLAMWARSHYKSGTLDSIIDPNLTGQIAPECLRKFGEVAEMCVRNEGNERPSMGDVVWGLEFTLQLQLTAESNEDHINGTPDPGPGRAEGEISSPNNVGSSGVFAKACNEMISEESSSTSSLTTKSEVDHHMRSYNVFSEIMRSQGR